MSFSIYYLILYFIIIFTSLFRLIAEGKDPNTPENKFQWKKIFFISNEIIYTGSGVYILLLSNTKWNAPVFAFLVLILLISHNVISLADKFSINVKFTAHIVIICIIIFSTFLTFHFEDDIIGTPKISTLDSSTFKISIPYCDKSAVKYYGFDKFGDKYFSYFVQLNALSERDAINNAVSNFWNDSLVLPIVYKDKPKKDMIKIDIDHIVAKKLDHKIDK